MTTTPLTHIVGAGLIGASIGIGLSAEGWRVTISDADPETELLARSIGAGLPPDRTKPDLVIVATPPGVTADVVSTALNTWPKAVVVDVASVKAPIAEAAARSGQGHRYVGAHPMAGREISGAMAAQGDLFRARPWVICPGTASDAAVALVRSVAEALQCDVVMMDALAHDRAVARVSHAPQAAASAVAAALGTLGADDVALAGQGLRDVTRIAASHPAMWADIARLNRSALIETLDHIVAELDEVRSAPDIGSAMSALIDKGRREVARIPGKHGGAKREWEAVTVIVPDSPGHLVRLLSDAAAVGVNVEDISIEHSPRQPVGLTTLWVLPQRASELVKSLESAGWVVAGS
jgi:prephenate dehydrogenase